ncbi:50S ribosomal protein L11 methyltransferase [Solirubrobacter taibaiensis]|nr:50S ribosomal protein L11 methyltransferase [Solirubrobacter taibaiensis]
MIRLGIRVRAVDAEVAYARLEPILAAGFEQVEDGEHVEFVVYGEDRQIKFPELVSVSRQPIADGWQTAWHEHLAPVTVGAITIRPPWLPGPGLVVDPGETFGLASHPTTKLCLELLQELPLTPLADWGCGCGVLSVAAKHLGFEPVVGIELDPGAVAMAVKNGIDAHVGDIVAEPLWARTVVANLTAGLIASFTEGPSEPVTLLTSGLIAHQADVALSAFGPLGFVERERRERDGWAAVLLETA